MNCGLQRSFIADLWEVLQAVQKLIDEEFQGIVHLRTSTLHKKIASARHDFIKLSGSENKLEALLQVSLFVHFFLVSNGYKANNILIIEILRITTKLL